MRAAEQSTSEGWLIQDVLAFPDAGPPAPVVFGCEASESGEIFRQTADGILGMGNSAVSFAAQVCVCHWRLRFRLPLLQIHVMRHQLARARHAAAGS